MEGSQWGGDNCGGPMGPYGEAQQIVPRRLTLGVREAIIGNCCSSLALEAEMVPLVRFFRRPLWLWCVPPVALPPSR